MALRIESRSLGGHLHGNVVSETIDSFRLIGNDMWDRFTGRAASSEAQQIQLELARTQAQRLAAQTQARSEALGMLFQALPWLVGGAVVLGAGYVLLKKKR